MILFVKKILSSSPEWANEVKQSKQNRILNSNNKGFSLCVPVGKPLWQIQKDTKNIITMWLQPIVLTIQKKVRKVFALRLFRKTTLLSKFRILFCIVIASVSVAIHCRQNFYLCGLFTNGELCPNNKDK